jgi:deoxyuridine 5'-triphosphate nucleotidohydrolase
MHNKLQVKYDEELKKAGFILKYAKANDIGLDLPVVMTDKLKIAPHKDYYIDWKERWFDIPPMGIAEVPCGMAVKVPEHSWGNIKPRSSTGWKRHLVVYEGVIDTGFTGPLYVLVKNPNAETVRVKEFEKLAQLIIIPKFMVWEAHKPTFSGRIREPGEQPIIERTPLVGHPIEVVGVNELPKTERGTDGFGSSGR